MHGSDVMSLYCGRLTPAMAGFLRCKGWHNGRQRVYPYLSYPWLVTHRLQVWVQVHSKVPVGYPCRSLTVLQKTHTSRCTGKWLSTWSGQVADWAQYSSWGFFLGIKVCHLAIKLRNWVFVWSSTMFGQVSWWLSEQHYWVEGQLCFIEYGSIQHIESVN